LWVMWPVAGRVPSRRPAASIVAPPAAVLVAGRYIRTPDTRKCKGFSAGRLSCGQDSHRISRQDPEGHSVNEWKCVGKNRTPVAANRNPIGKTGSIQDRRQDPEGSSISGRKS
ncbi:hypothetical protein ACLOJK_004398, partial [Asimina triloba]